MNRKYSYSSFRSNGNRSTLKYYILIRNIYNYNNAWNFWPHVEAMCIADLLYFTNGLVHHGMILASG